MKAGKGCKMSKSDMTSAFRNLGILCRQWKYLIMKAESPLDNKVYYFVDKCLPFGAAISCAVFQKFSDAIAYVVKRTSGKENLNYLDDFLFITLLKSLCDGQLNYFLKVCRDINFPVSVEKTYFSDTQMVFLGFLIDSVRQLVLIPMDKIDKGRDLIEGILGNGWKKVTVKKLQNICGFLNFLGRCILPGRAFTRRLYY